MLAAVFGEKLGLGTPHAMETPWRALGAVAGKVEGGGWLFLAGRTGLPAPAPPPSRLRRLRIGGSEPARERCVNAYATHDERSHRMASLRSRAVGSRYTPTFISPAESADNRHVARAPSCIRPQSAGIHLARSAPRRPPRTTFVSICDTCWLGKA